MKVATTKSQRKLFFNLRKLKKHLSWLSKDEVSCIAENLNVSEADVVKMDSRIQQHDLFFDQSFGGANQKEAEP